MKAHPSYVIHYYRTESGHRGVTLRATALRLVRLLGLWCKRRRDRRELAQLDARTLRDIGLAPGDVEFLINKPFWRA